MLIVLYYIQFNYLLIFHLIFSATNFLLTDKNLQMLYECEQERFVYKSCLRDLIKMKRTEKHTSWRTADVSALYLS